MQILISNNTWISCWSRFPKEAVSSEELETILTVDAANKVYQSIVLPVMDYCDVAWSSIGKIADKLDRALEKGSKD